MTEWKNYSEEKPEVGKKCIVFTDEVESCIYTYDPTQDLSGIDRPFFHWTRRLEEDKVKYWAYIYLPHREIA